MNPNFELLLWALLIYKLIDGVVLVIAGSMGMEKITHDKYNVGHTVIGLVWVMFIMYVLLS